MFCSTPADKVVVLGLSSPVCAALSAWQAEGRHSYYAAFVSCSGFSGTTSVVRFCCLAAGDFRHFIICAVSYRIKKQSCCVEQTVYVVSALKPFLQQNFKVTGQRIAPTPHQH